MVIEGKTLDLGKVTIPIYELATKRGPYRARPVGFHRRQHFGGPVRYVMAGSGHIAGVVNPPAKPKYQYWTGGPPSGEFAAWVAAAQGDARLAGGPTGSPGSPTQAPDKVPARQPGGGQLAPLGDAPGEYVRVKV